MRANRHNWTPFEQWAREEKVRLAIVKQDPETTVDIQLDGVTFATVPLHEAYERQREIWEYMQTDEHGSAHDHESYNPGESWCDTTNQFTR